MKGISCKRELECREPLDGVKWQKVFCNITREQPAENIDLKNFKYIE